MYITLEINCLNCDLTEINTRKYDRTKPDTIVY